MPAKIGGSEFSSALPGCERNSGTFNRVMAFPLASTQKAAEPRSKQMLFYSFGSSAAVAQEAEL